MNTVNLKITSGGRLVLAHPHAKHGPDHLIYAINNVPDNVLPAQVAQQVLRVCLVHPHDDASAWSYDWDELARLKQGAIINRYRRAA